MPAESCSANPQDNYRPIEIFASVIPLVLAVFAIAGRVGFGAQVKPVVVSAGLALFLINLSAIWPSDKLAFATRTMAIVSATIGLGLVGLVGSKPSAIIGQLLAAFGAALFVYNAISMIRKKPATVLLCILLGGMIGAYALRSFGLGFRHPLYQESFLVGRGNPDEAFNAAIAGDIRTYNRPSLGLDGLPMAHYHFGSHWWMRAVADLAGASIADMYSYMSAILLVPVLIFCLMYLGVRIRSSIHRGEKTGAFPGGLLGMMVLLVGIVTPFPKVGDSLRATLDLMFISDSYALGLAMAFLTIAVAIDYYESLSKPRRAVQRYLLPLLIFPLLIAVLTSIKVSIPYILVGCAIYFSRRAREKDRFTSVVIGVSALTFFGLLLFFGSGGAGYLKLAPLNFDRITPEWRPYFFVFYFAWLWALLVLQVKQLKIRTLGELIEAMKANRMVGFEFTLSAAILGLVPYLLLGLGPDWAYFTEFQMFLGIVFVFAYVPHIGVRDIARPKEWRGWDVGHLAAAGLALVFGSHVVISTAAAGFQAVKLNAQLRCELAGINPDAWKSNLRKIYSAHRGELSQSLNERLRLLNTLRSVYGLPDSEKRTSLLYIPKTNRSYWAELQRGPEISTPFLATAITGMAMVEGVPEMEDIRPWYRDHFLYPSFNLPTELVKPDYASWDRLKRTAEKWKMEQLVIVGGSADCCAMEKIPLNTTGEQRYRTIVQNGRNAY